MQTSQVPQERNCEQFAIFEERSKLVALRGNRGFFTSGGFLVFSRVFNGKILGFCWELCCLSGDFYV